jgi:hypothetical protein
VIIDVSFRCVSWLLTPRIAIASSVVRGEATQRARIARACSLEAFISSPFRRACDRLSVDNMDDVRHPTKVKRQLPGAKSKQFSDQRAAGLPNAVTTSWLMPVRTRSNDGNSAAMPTQGIAPEKHEHQNQCAR